MWLSSALAFWLIPLKFIEEGLKTLLKALFFVVGILGLGFCLVIGWLFTPNGFEHPFETAYHNGTTLYTLQDLVMTQKIDYCHNGFENRHVGYGRFNTWEHRHAGYFNASYQRAAFSSYVLSQAIGAARIGTRISVDDLVEQECPQTYTVSSILPVVELSTWRQDVVGMCEIPHCHVPDMYPVNQKWGDVFSTTPPVTPEQESTLQVLRWVDTDDFWAEAARKAGVRVQDVLVYRAAEQKAVEQLLSQ